MNVCPGREQLEALLSEQLNGAERAAVETRGEGSAACQRVLHEFAGDTTDDRVRFFRRQL